MAGTFDDLIEQEARALPLPPVTILTLFTKRIEPFVNNANLFSTFEVPLPFESRISEGERLYFKCHVICFVLNFPLGLDRWGSDLSLSSTLVLWGSHSCLKILLNTKDCPWGAERFGCGLR